MNRRNTFQIVGAAMALVGVAVVIGGFWADRFWLVGTGLALPLLAVAVAIAPTKIPVLMKRELRSLFVSPLAYVLLTAFLVLMGISFYSDVQYGASAPLGRTYGSLFAFSLFLCPLLSMRLLAEERRLGTMEMLLTTPVTEAEVVVGKFLAAWISYAIIVAPTLIYVVIVANLGRPDYGPIFARYGGALLVGGLFLAAALLVSAFTRNPVVAAFVGFVVCFLLGFAHSFFPELTGSPGDVIRWVCIEPHYSRLFEGRILTSDLVYFASGITFFLFLTTRTLEWRKAS